MSKLRFKISLSLDGFVAGTNQSVENPLGISDNLHRFDLVRTVVAPKGTHFKFIRR